MTDPSSTPASPADPVGTSSADAERIDPTDGPGGLHFAVRLPGEPGRLAVEAGPARRDWDQLEPTADDRPIWVHLDLAGQRAASWIRSVTPDASVSDGLLAAETRPRVESIGDDRLIILRGVNRTPEAEPDELIAIRLWVTADRVVTLRQYRFQTIRDLRQRADQATAPSTTGGLVAAVAAGLSDRLASVVEQLVDRLDEIEDGLADDSTASRDGSDATRENRARLATANVRRQAIRLRRYLSPQREALNRLVTDPAAWMSSPDRQSIRTAVDATVRLIEALEEVRDRAAVTQDELRARHEARAGRTLYLLTIVATIALPLGLITGLLGINVGGMPLAGSSAGFWIVCAMLVLLAAGEFWIVRRLRLI